jgi:hypothetical protein
MATKFLTKATARNGFTYAIQKRGNGYSVVYSTGFCWKYAEGGKIPMNLQSAQFLFDLCLL